jgi:sugar phosphate isomerase/epimerase
MSSEAKSIPEIIAAHRNELAHFHANDPNRRGPGMGQVDFVPILKSLIDANYRGWVSVEVFDESPGIDALAGQSICNLRRDYARALAL